VLGCAVDAAESVEHELAPVESVEETSSALSGDTTRSDFVRSVSVSEGIWGSWSATRYCPAGTFAVGYDMRVEGGQGSGDDTALNAVRLHCAGPNATYPSVVAHDGWYGSWHPSAVCSGTSYLSGAALRLEGSQGSGDDTGANDVRFRCSNGTDIQAPGGMGYGSWGATNSCPAGTAVCGVQVRTEGLQGDGDDTAMNGMRLACCSQPTVPARLRTQEYSMPGVSARVYTSDTGAYRTPLVFVEGFDSDNDFTVDSFRDQLPAGMLQSLTAAGYSVAFVDLTNNWTSIKENSRNLGAFLERVWGDSQKVEPIKILGASMGGLIATNAAVLRSHAATLGEPVPAWTFKVNHVMTLDSPHQGAYIPQAIYHVLLRFNQLDGTARRLYSAITSTASKEMMLVPYNDEFRIAHANWQSYYDRVLGLMRDSNIRFTAIVNGSNNGTNQYSAWTPGALNVSVEKRTTAVDIDAWLYTQPNPGGQVARIKVDWFGIGADEDKNYYSMSGNWPLVENGPGGFAGFWTRTATSIQSGAVVTFPNHTFVPSFSAIGMPLAQYQALPADVRNNLTAVEAARGQLTNTVFSPFDRIISGSANTKHAQIPAALQSVVQGELGVTLQPSFTMPQRGGTGPSSGSLAAQFFTGATIASGAVVDRLVLAGISGTTTPTTVKRSFGGAGGSAASVQCKAGDHVVGYFGNTMPVNGVQTISKLGLWCRGASGDYRVGGAGYSASAFAFDDKCPSGYALGTVFTSFGSYLNSIRSVCNKRASTALPAVPGSTGGFAEGCRGTGTWVCQDRVVGYSRYYINHPECSVNTYCPSWAGLCNAACPAPTELDR
jgi:pimeloyl-ACP methyl ester carboxylesterase